jgi:hypothetical protein
MLYLMVIMVNIYLIKLIAIPFVVSYSVDTMNPLTEGV